MLPFSTPVCPPDLSIGQKLEDVTKSDNSGNKLRLKVQSKDFRSKIDIVINKASDSPPVQQKCWKVLTVPFEYYFYF